MSQVKCPHCKAHIDHVEPVRVRVVSDDLGWRGRIPEAMGFNCPTCYSLLPLTATQVRDDAQ